MNFTEFARFHVPINTAVGSGGFEDGNGGGGGSSAHEAGASYLPDLDSIRCEPTLSSLRNDVFAVACGFDSCHGNNNAAWGLYLVAPDLERELVGTSAATCAGWQRVAPGSLEQSFLYQKLTSATPPCGERMPFDLPPLPEHVLLCVAGWIQSLHVDAGGGGYAKGGANAADANARDASRSP